MSQTGQQPAEVKMQRAEGEGRISVSLKGGKTRLDDLYQSGAAKIRLPQVHDGNHAEAVLINVCGGLTGGDRFLWNADLAANAAMVVTTQACEKIYRAGQGQAEVKVSLKLAEGAALSWLPQEAILFEHSALRRVIDADICASSRLLIVESAILGRAAFGETVRQVFLQDSWRIRVEGKLVHAEEGKILGNPKEIASGPARLNCDTAFATLVYIAPDAAKYPSMLRSLPQMSGVQSGCSLLPAFQSAKLIARFVATDGLALRRALIPAIEVIQGGPPKVWRL